MNNVQTRKSLYGFEFREPDERRVEDRKTYNIKSLWQRNHEIVNLAARGLKYTEIAEVLGIRPETVSSTLNSDLGMQKLSDIRGERDEEAKKISAKIAELTKMALDVYHEIFKNSGGIADTKLRKETADTVMLELSGYRAPTRTQSISVSATPEEIEEFKRRGIAAARESGMIVDLEPEEIEDRSEESKTSKS